MGDMAMVEPYGASERLIRRCCQRLRFAVLSILLFLACSSPSLSQGQKVIGVLSPFIDAQSTFARDLRDGLAAHGLHEGRGVIIEYRSAEGHVERLPALAQELVTLKVEVIVTASAPAIRFAQQATKTIPIVMARVGDAVDQGFVQSLAHPGGNLTGISWLAPELSAKRLELLKQALPGVNRVGILREASASASSIIAVRAAAQALGIIPSVFEVREPSEFPTALAAMAEARVDAVEILEGLMIFNSVRPLVTLTDARGLPTIFPDIGFVEAGGLMSYGPDFREIHRRTAAIVVKVLKGTPPGDIPVEQPTKFVFAINSRTANALGLAIAPGAVSRADVVIE
jgi:putative tryptophan/tyrosine transport system substrate-binding protein